MKRILSSAAARHEAVMAFLVSFALCILAPATTSYAVEDECPDIDGGELHKKVDYYYAKANAHREGLGPWQTLKTNEANHFNSDVRNLVRGQSVYYVAGDLAFMLRNWPNHPAVLDTLVRLAIRDKTNLPEGLKIPVECWLERAVRFKPDDANARIIYGTYLARLKQTDKAIEQLELAKQARPDESNVYYNLGLLYFDKQDYARSLSYAKQAYAMGFPLPGLKNKLVRAGKWDGKQ